MMNTHSSARKGFTLIELLVVIAIIGILAAVVLASLNSARERSRDANRLAQIKQVKTIMEAYYAENGSYPAGTCRYLHQVTELAPLIAIDAVHDPIHINTSNEYRYCPSGGGTGYSIRVRFENAEPCMTGTNMPANGNNWGVPVCTNL